MVINQVFSWAVLYIHVSYVQYMCTYMQTEVEFFDTYKNM